MRKFLFLIAVTVSCLTASAQVYQDADYVNPKDTVLMDKFLERLAISVNAEDSKNLIELIDFPIYCGACQPESSSTTYSLISKKRFIRDHAEILFKPLTRRLLHYPSAKRRMLIRSFTDLASGNRYYSFGYALDNSRYMERVILFDFKKVGNKFKIKSIHRSI